MRSAAAALDHPQADPTLPEKDPKLLHEFVAAPWLLPPRTKALPYAGVHDLDQLLALRATREGRLDKAITLLTFTAKFAVMTQNTSERQPLLRLWCGQGVHESGVLLTGLRAGVCHAAMCANSVSGQSCPPPANLDVTLGSTCDPRCSVPCMRT